MLEKQEKKESHKKWENLYVFTGRKSDLTTMISIAVINRTARRILDFIEESVTICVLLVSISHDLQHKKTHDINDNNHNCYPTYH